MQTQNLNEILAHFRSESVKALKGKDGARREILNTLINDLLVDGKEPEPNEGLDKLISLVKSYKKALNLGGNMQPYLDILEPFLPTKLTKDQLLEIVEEKGFSNMGEAMKYFKASGSFFEPVDLKEIIESRKK
jgi:hypothetical protein